MNILSPVKGLISCGNRVVRYGWISITCFAILIITPVFTPAVHTAEQAVTIGVYENEPKIFTAERNKPAGIFIDIIEYIAEQENWKISYVTGTWAECLKRLEKGEIDIMPDMAYTADREKRFSFHTVPVLSSWSQVYTGKGRPIRSILDLDGTRIAVLKDSIQQDSFSGLTGRFGLNITIVPVPDYKTMFKTVSGGKADAGITNRFFGLMHAKQYGLVDTAIVFDPTELFYATPAGDPKQLLKAIDRHLTRLKKEDRSLYYRSLQKLISEDVRFEVPVWLKMALVVIGTVMLVSLAGSLILKQRVNARTRELNEANRKMRQYIIERQVTERALQENEQKYRELVEHANSIILRWTKEGIITFLNEFGLRFFGYGSDEIIGRSVMETIVAVTDSEGRDLRKMIEQITTDPRAFGYNINENIRSNGERVWVAWTNRVVIDEQGEIVEILSIGTDITEQKRAEEAIRELNARLEQRVSERTAELAVAKEEAENADRIKSAFLATMSHELRTPLNSIIGFTGIILQELAGPLTEEQAKQLGMVRNSAQHLLSLINDILDISKIEAGQYRIHNKEIDIREVIEKSVDAMKPIADRKGLSLSLSIGDDVVKAWGDRRRVEQIILNLISNAVKFTDEGGISVRAGLIPGKDQTGFDCSTVASFPAVRVEVRDTGIGIDIDDLSELFQPFRQLDTGITRRNEGTGLGLAICRRLANLMGGEIYVESEWGKGSSFSLILPVQGELNENEKEDPVN